MRTGQKTENRKKNSETQGTELTDSLPLFLLTSGPSRTIWSMSTVANKLLVELIPVFDSEAGAQELLNSLQDKSYQTSTVLFPKLATLVADRKALFILNPTAEIQGGQVYLREGPNWKLTLEQLSLLLVSEPEKSRTSKR